MDFSISILSGDDFEDTATMHLYPLTIAIIERLNPVLPELVSIIVESLSIKPDSSAFLIMCRAILSLLECPGLYASYLQKCVPEIPLITLFNLISGVFPMRESIFSWTSKSGFLQEHSNFANLGIKN